MLERKSLLNRNLPVMKKEINREDGGQAKCTGDGIESHITYMFFYETRRKAWQHERQGHERLFPFTFRQQAQDCKIGRETETKCQLLNTYKKADGKKVGGLPDAEKQIDKSWQGNTDGHRP